MPVHAIPQFPHCDQNVLHKPGLCRYCDAHPDWQELREVWGINFTGESDTSKFPCPSIRFRTAEQAQRWHGNQPTTGPVPDVLDDEEIDDT